MPKGSVRSLLIYPPVTDPTSGYHSLSYLQAYAKARGYQQIEILDTNIEAICFMAQPGQLERLQAYGKQVYTQLGEQERLDGEEQLMYHHAWLCTMFDPDAVSRAMDIMRDPQTFYQVPSYYEAAQTILGWLKCLSLWGYPGQFDDGFSLEVHGRLNLNSIADLTNWTVLSRVSGPFQPYFEEDLLPRIQASQYHLVGLNISYVYQLPFALWLIRRIKDVAPDAFIVVGGTEVSDVWKYTLPPDGFQRVFQDADACVVGEGESVFVHILDCLSDGRRVKPAPNLILHPRHNQGEGLSVHPITVQYEDLTQIPTPDFSQLPWDKYLSPEPFVYYSPSRGCYWNKCTFCDYGLNFDSPTSPWRADTLDKILADLRQIAQVSRFVYFSVDALAPAALLNIAEGIVREGLDIRWSAEIRLETYWSRERCQLLKKSGCVAISVGFESGNQRILDLIDKGTRPKQVAETIRHFTDAGIGVQIMGFTGFPGETAAEAYDSINFLKAHSANWTYGGLGTFVLTPGAMIARDPSRFGITDVRPYDGEDIARHWFFRDPVAEEQRQKLPDLEQKLKEAKSSLDRAPFPRPFLGGVDTAHTLMYHDCYGTDILEATAVVPSLDQVTDTTVLALNGQVTHEIHGFAPDRLIYSVANLYDDETCRGRSLNFEQLTHKLSEQLVERKVDPAPFFVRKDGAFIRLHPPLSRLLQAVAASKQWSDALDYLRAQGEQRTFYRCLLGFALDRRMVVSAAADRSYPPTAGIKTQP